jgi:hypothetical protein
MKKKIKINQVRKFNLSWLLEWICHVDWILDKGGDWLEKIYKCTLVAVSCGELEWWDWGLLESEIL